MRYETSASHAELPLNLFDPQEVDAVTSERPVLRSRLANASHEGVPSQAFSAARRSSRQIYRVLSNPHYPNLRGLLDAIEFSLGCGFDQPAILRTRSRTSFVGALAELHAACHFLAHDFAVQGQDAVKDAASVPDLILEGHGLKLAVEVYCPLIWDGMREIDRFRIALKNLDVAYDYTFDITFDRMMRVDASGRYQRHPNEVSAAMGVITGGSCLPHLLDTLHAALSNRPPHTMDLDYRFDELNLHMLIRVSSIAGTRSRLPARAATLTGPSVGGYDPVGMFAKLTNRVRGKAAKRQAVGKAPLSLLLVDVSQSGLSAELQYDNYCNEFAKTLRHVLGSGLRGYDMIAFYEPGAWGHGLQLHYLVREEHIDAGLQPVLFGSPTVVS